MRRVPMLLLLGAAGFSLPSNAQTEGPLLASVQRAGEVKVGLGSAPPYIALSPDGHATGYIVEVLNLALKGMGLPALTPVLAKWDAMIPGLQARQFDFVGGQVITESRCKAVMFAAPIWVMRDALYTRPGNPKQLTGYSQVARSSDVKLAVITGTTQEAYALKQGVKSDQLVRVTDIQASAATVVGGRADAFVVGQFTITNPEEKGLQVVVDKQAPTHGFAAVFRKEDARFRDAFNEQLNVLRSNGTMEQLYVVKYGIPNWDALAKLTKAGDAEAGCE
ncbi:polar amino acid transport system substrate-binding protein [Bradyrhizobium sp. S3.12.5]|uniref:transporter substrate-binding domain-containing protein n=1 Tax=Bradyrhizobium sp. S3.12.5 TaxID=3156386 RepID=UPI0033955DF8